MPSVFLCETRSVRMSVTENVCRALFSEKPAENTVYCVSENVLHKSGKICVKHVILREKMP